MPRNTKGGKKHKRKKNKIFDNRSRELVLAEDNQVYGKVVGKFGISRLKILCSDDRTRSGIIRGKFKKRVWMNEGDIVLCTIGSMGTGIGKREDKQKKYKNKIVYDDCHIEHKYYQQDIVKLKSLGEINFKDNDDEDYEDSEEDIIVDIEENKENENIGYDDLWNKYNSDDSDSEDIYDDTEFMEKEENNLDLEIDFL